MSPIFRWQQPTKCQLYTDLKNSTVIPPSLKIEKKLNSALGPFLKLSFIGFPGDFFRWRSVASQRGRNMTTVQPFESEVNVASAAFTSENISMGDIPPNLAELLKRQVFWIVLFFYFCRSHAAVLRHMHLYSNHAYPLKILSEFSLLNVQIWWKWRWSPESSWSWTMRSSSRLLGIRAIPYWFLVARSQGTYCQSE